MKPGDLARVKGLNTSAHSRFPGADLVVLVQAVDQVESGYDPAVGVGDLWWVYSPELRGAKIINEIYLQLVSSV